MNSDELWQYLVPLMEKDPAYQQALQRVKETEPEYLALLETMTQENRDILERYIAAFPGLSNWQNPCRIMQGRQIADPASTFHCGASIFYTTSVKNQRFLPPSPQGEGFSAAVIEKLRLTVGGFFDTLTECKEAVKTNKPNPSAYIGTVGFGLCSKSKCLAEQAFLTPHPPKIKDFCHLLLKEKTFLQLSLTFCILTIGGFFDTLRRAADAARLILT